MLAFLAALPVHLPASALVPADFFRSLFSRADKPFIFPS
jgi:hypothetical protein